MDRERECVFVCTCASPSKRQIINTENKTQTMMNRITVFAWEVCLTETF